MKLIVLVLTMGLLGCLAGTAAADSIPSGWTCSGNCGSSGADGVVSLSPTGNSSYQWVSTTNGLSGVGALPTGALGSETNGSTLATSVFSATAGTSLSFYFNYVTSDGAGYADYAWAELFNSSKTPVALLFTARTESTGSIVPGTGLPNPLATLHPGSVPIIGGGPAWSPLGTYSGSCYAAGCGYTGWVNSSYTIATAGSYYLEIGVTNWIDKLYDSGLALDGVSVGGVPITPGGGTPPPVTTPEPGTLALLSVGLVGLLARRRKHKDAVITTTWEPLA
jgi:PEP-CTERM motif